MTKWGYGVLFIILSLLGGGIWIWREHHSVIVGRTAPFCDATLWAHVYHPNRLQILDQCVVRVGKVIAIRKEADGDYHIMLEGGLVLEPICQLKPTVKAASEACNGFKGKLFKRPAVGATIRVTGMRVFDTKHNWEEIHPVSSIENIAKD